MRRLRFPIPISIVLFLALTAAGAYHARRAILERHMAAAVEVRDESAVRMLLESWPCPVDAQTKDGVTALHWAAATGNRALAARCLAKGARLDLCGADPLDDLVCPRGTPLHWAVLYERTEIVDALITHGADVNAVTDAGECQVLDTPLDYAVAGGNKPLVEKLLAAGASVESAGHQFDWPLMLAARAGNTEIMRLLLDRGARIDRSGVDGYTALHHAVLDNQPASVRFLLEKGANPNARDMGASPLDVAAEQGNAALAEMLRAHGAKE